MVLNPGMKLAALMFRAKRIDSMNATVEKLLLIESDKALREHIAEVLSNAGYEVSTGLQGGMKSILAVNPEIVLLGANPPQLDCCDLLSEIKGSPQTQNIRVLILAPGGAAERARALDLGADDVLSVPFDAHELLSRVRSQMRSKHLADSVDTNQVVTVVNEERRMLRVGVMAALAVLLVVGVVFISLYYRTSQQNARVYASISKLQSGLLVRQQSMQRALRRAPDAGTGPGSASATQKPNLPAGREELGGPPAGPDPKNDPSLQHQMAEVTSRVQKLEAEGKFAQSVIRSYEPSVCLIHVVLGFRDPSNGRALRYASLNSEGAPATDEHNNPLLSFSGSGPEARLNIFGTGFLVSAGGEILTNHHVAEPWWHNDEIKEMTNGELEPVISEMTAYFPGVRRGIPLSTYKISSTADVAILKGDVSKLGIKHVTLASNAGSAGEPVVLLGYPTAIDAILARTPEQTLQTIAAASGGDPQKVVEELARRDLIRPITTQGHIGDVLPDKIIYDAPTTVGGSGGPLFNGEGKVIGINFAIMPEFAGSNFAVPVTYGRSLLKP